MDEPFVLRNTPIYIKPPKVKGPPDIQLTLFRGLGDSPGQEDLFDLEPKENDDGSDNHPAE